MGGEQHLTFDGGHHLGGDQFGGPGQIAMGGQPVTHQPSGVHLGGHQQFGHPMIPGGHPQIQADQTMPVIGGNRNISQPMNEFWAEGQNVERPRGSQAPAKKVVRLLP